MEDLMEVMVDTEAMEVMVMERERLRLSQDMVMDMEDLMEVMVDIEAMVVMDMEREKLKLMPSQDMVMVDTEAMVVMDMEREMLNQVMDMVVMVVVDLMVV